MALKKSDMELPHLLRNMEAKVVRDTEPTKEKESTQEAVVIIKVVTTEKTNVHPKSC